MVTQSNRHIEQTISHSSTGIGMYLCFIKSQSFGVSKAERTSYCRSRCRGTVKYTIQLLCVRLHATFTNRCRCHIMVAFIHLLELHKGHTRYLQSFLQKKLRSSEGERAVPAGMFPDADIILLYLILEQEEIMYSNWTYRKLMKWALLIKRALRQLR